MPSTPLFDRRLWWIAASLTILWAVLLDGRPLLDPDEGRYAEIPREMLENGNWVIPHLNDLAYLEKPPLQYWATAISYRIFGVHEWSARLWTGLTSLLTVLAVFVFAARTWGHRAGLRAAGILASSTLYVLVGHQLTLDASMTFFLTLALLAFCNAQTHRGVPATVRWSMIGCWGAMGAAVLTKGVIGVLIPGSVLALYCLWQRDWRLWQHLHLHLGLALFVIIVAPWFVLAARANSNFLQFFFVHEHLQRFLTMSADRNQPWWYFLMILAIGALPWLPQVTRALLTGWRRSSESGVFDARRVLWLWCVFILVFFSASHSKLSPYILPMFPALALLVASNTSRTRAGDTLGSLVFTVAAAAGVFVLANTSSAAGHDAARIAAWVAMQPKLNGIAAILLLGAVCTLGALRSGVGRYAGVILGVAWLLSVGGLIKSLGPINPTLSGKSLALAAPEGQDRRVPVYTVDMYIHALPFYWQRSLTLVDYRGELALGLSEHAHAAVNSIEAFKQLWIASPDALAVMPTRTYQRLEHEDLPMRVVAQTTIAVIVDRR